MNDFEKYVKEFLEKRGWAVLRNGWPDFLCYDSNFTSKQHDTRGRVMAVEVKRGSDKLSDAQRYVHAALSRAGMAVHVVRPDDINRAKKMGGKLVWNAEHLRALKDEVEAERRAIERQKEKLDQIDEALNSYGAAFELDNGQIHENPANQAFSVGGYLSKPVSHRSI